MCGQRRYREGGLRDDLLIGYVEKICCRSSTPNRCSVGGSVFYAAFRSKIVITKLILCHSNRYGKQQRHKFSSPWVQLGEVWLPSRPTTNSITTVSSTRYSCVWSTAQLPCSPGSLFSLLWATWQRTWARRWMKSSKAVNFYEILLTKPFNIAGVEAKGFEMVSSLSRIAEQTYFLFKSGIKQGTFFQYTRNH